MIIANFLLILTAFVFCQPNEWNGIIPLKSTRTDVERILGIPGPGNTSREIVDYKTADAKVTILYSGGRCESKANNGWNVPESVVLNVLVYPNVRPKFADLDLDKKKWRTKTDPHILTNVYWINANDGIHITVDSISGEVLGFLYFPESKMNKLKCQ